MKNLKYLVALGGIAALAACSSSRPKNGDDVKLAASGPTVVSAHAEPDTIELNPFLAPLGQAKVIAEVKDLGSPVTEVHLRFRNVPIDVPMQNIGGTTWVATISPPQLQEIAVRGKTISYDAEIFAKDEKGFAAISHDYVSIAIKTPDAPDPATG